MVSFAYRMIFVPKSAVSSVVTSELESFAVGPQRAVGRTEVVAEVLVAPGVGDHHHTQTTASPNLPADRNQFQVK